jgi:hypothetical protein
MSFTMKINMKEVEDWVKNQAHRDMARKQAMTVMKNELMNEVKKELSEHRSSGELEGSLSGIATDKKLEIWSNMYGDIVLEYGRRPGKMPPVEQLERWAMLHGMDRGAGYMIARKIAQRGTEKYRKGGPKQISEIEERFNRDIMPSRMEYLLNEYTK